MRRVLDTSALLVLLNAEPGVEIVAQALPLGVMSAVNLSEVIAKLAEKGMPEAVARQAIGWWQWKQGLSMMSSRI